MKRVFVYVMLATMLLSGSNVQAAEKFCYLFSF